MRGEPCSKQQGGRRQQTLNCAQLTANQQPVYVVLQLHAAYIIPPEQLYVARAADSAGHWLFGGGV